MKPLLEARNVAQKEVGVFRRWFENDFFDLIVWYKPDGKTLIGFQLCYDKSYAERALTWTIGGGYQHDRIDDGEPSPIINSTPLVVADGVFDSATIANKFLEAAGSLEKELRDLIYDKIREYSP